MVSPHSTSQTLLSPRDYTQAASLSIEGLCHFIAGRYTEAVEVWSAAPCSRGHNFGTAWRTLAAAAGLAGESGFWRGAR